MNPTQTHLLEPGTLVDGRYRIQKKIGEGGFAMVYAAIHEGLDRPVALKVLDLTGNSRDMASFHERFRREAKLAGSIRHPHVVHIHDFGVVSQNGQPYAAMDLLEGYDLEHELLSHGPLEPRRAFALFSGALQGLSAAHQRGIVHKDLKPSNLFIVHPRTPHEKMVVLDFGIARVYDDPSSKLTQTSQYTGTPAYAAPEYITAQTVTPAVDVYQMGLIIAESLSGQPVVQASSPMAFFLAHCNGQQRIDPKLDGTQLGELLRRAVAVDPKMRPQSAMEFQQELVQVSHSTLPAISRHPSAPPQAHDLNALLAHAKTLDSVPPTPNTHTFPRQDAAGQITQPTQKSTKSIWGLLFVISLVTFGVSLFVCVSFIALAAIGDQEETELDPSVSTHSVDPNAIATPPPIEKIEHVKQTPDKTWVKRAKLLSDAYSAIYISWSPVEKYVNTSHMLHRKKGELRHKSLTSFWRGIKVEYNYNQSQSVIQSFLGAYQGQFPEVVRALANWSEALASLDPLFEEQMDYWSSQPANSDASFAYSSALDDRLQTAYKLYKKRSEALFQALYDANDTMLTQRIEDTKKSAPLEAKLAELMLQTQKTHLLLLKNPTSLQTTQAGKKLRQSITEINNRRREEGFNTQTVRATVAQLKVYVGSFDAYIKAQNTPVSVVQIQILNFPQRHFLHTMKVYYTLAGH